MSVEVIAVASAIVAVVATWTVVEAEIPACAITSIHGLTTEIMVTVQ